MNNLDIAFMYKDGTVTEVNNVEKDVADAIILNLSALENVSIRTIKAEAYEDYSYNKALDDLIEVLAHSETLYNINQFKEIQLIALMLKDEWKKHIPSLTE